MCRVKASTHRCIATGILVVGIVLCHFILELESEAPYLVPFSAKSSRCCAEGTPFQWKLWQNIIGSDPEGDKMDEVDAEDDYDDIRTADENPFPPPLYGYDSLEELQNRPERFPSVSERVQVYMSNWYLPPCPHSFDRDSMRDTATESGYIQYKYYSPDDDNDDDSIGSTSFPLLLVHEVPSQAKNEGYLREFAIDAHNGLGKIYYLESQQMREEQCNSEYCVDMVRHWIPAMERVLQYDDSVPVLFQFSDDELSKAYDLTTEKNEPYPNLPHLKKSRLSLNPQDIFKIHQRTCEPAPKAILPTVAQMDHVPEHLQPSTSLFCLVSLVYRFQ